MSLLDKIFRFKRKEIEDNIETIEYYIRKAAEKLAELQEVVDEFKKSEALKGEGK